MPAAAFASRAVRVRPWSFLPATVLLALALVVAGALLAVQSPNANGAKISGAAASSCSTPRPLPVGDSVRTLTHDGEQRTYQLHVPPGYDGAQRLPVVFLFHGLGGTPQKVMGTSGMGRLADAQNFIVVAPLARGKVTEWDFRSPGNVVNSDVSFVRQLTDTVSATTCADETSLYAAGFSNGSALVLALACDPQSRFASYGAVSGPYISPSCGRAKPASVAYFHGARDDVVPYTGAHTRIGPLGGVDDTIAQWVAQDKCPARGATTSVHDGVRHFSWTQCAEGSAVSVFVNEGSGHRWPDRPLDASAMMWKFFQKSV